MDIKDLKKAGLNKADKITIKKIEVEDKKKGREIEVEEISIKRNIEKKSKSKFKKYWGKFWFLLWKDNSMKGWAFSIIFLFVFIKLIFFPGMSLITGTTLPLAIVESCSMYHNGIILHNYDAWWEKHESKYENFELDKESFKDFKLNNGFDKGDILFIIGTKPENLKIGDIIIFNGGQRNPIIHRIIKIKNTDGKYVFSTIGDNNNQQLGIEQEISEDQIIGKAVFKIAPYLGWGKLIFFEAQKSKSERGFCGEN